MAALFCAVLPVAQAAGLGKLTLLSALGQPLNAEVEIVSLQAGEEGLSARLASSQAFAQAGIEPNPALSDVRFTIERRGATPIVRLRSSQPINEPFLELLVELSWSGGSQVRKYTLILDPPQYKSKAAAPLSQVSPVKPAAEAPLSQTASVAPVAVIGLGTVSLPQPGDRWTYQLTERKRSDAPRQRSYAVRVLSSTPTAIVDRFSVDDRVGEDREHERGGYLLSQGASIFSPYLQVFENVAPPARLGTIVVTDPACSTSFYVCTANGRVVGRETIKVAAGTFDAVKVEIEHTWQGASGSVVHAQQMGQLRGARNLTIWYAPAAKRAVKFVSRQSFGDYPAIEADFDLELTSYQLK